VCSLFSVVLGASVWAADWPRFLGPDGSGISPETGLNQDWATKPPKMLWKVDLYNPGYAGPSVVGESVFIMDRNRDDDQEEIKAFNLKTGKLIWKYAYEDLAFDNYGYARVTPTFDNGKLYTLGMIGRLNCLNAVSGKLIWSLNLIKDLKGSYPTWYFAASPVVDGDRLLVFSGGASNLVILNKNTGKVILRGGNDDPVSYATPLIATLNGQKQYLLFSTKNVMGVLPENGKVLWKYPWVTGSDVNAANPLVIGENQVFISSAYNHGCALLTISSDGQVTKEWQNKNIMAHFNTPILYQDFIYGMNNPGESSSVVGDLVCLDPKTGNVLWKETGFGKGGVLMADGALFAVKKDGNLIMAKASADSYQELGRIKLPLNSPARSWAAPILADGKILIRDLEALVCYDLK
ncbi:MAG TPA: PQQ-binding-like beta-propeller repeat protein, partial [Bacillota bacterium]|nr:PQQ-binding-like beta-propeller repeat protein [Bacillota bacterium]